MKTIGIGLIQIPLVKYYRVCMCFKKPLVFCVSGSGWKMFLQSVLRITLLVLWGMPKIDYSYPQTETKVIGIYFEIGILAMQVMDGILTIMSSWFKNLYMLYPFLVVVPVSFVVDFTVKGTCYAQLFLWPEVTTFGVFSLIEVWFRNFSQLYCWIAIVSFIYLSRGKKDPFENDEKSANLSRKSSTVKSPFSRSSTLSVRGRRSFLLRAKKEDGKVIRNSVSDKSMPDTKNYPEDKQLSKEDDDDWSSLLPNDTQPVLTSVDGQSQNLSPDAVRSLSDNFSFHRHSEVGEKPTKPRYKRVGGFVPEVLRTPSNATDIFNTVEVKEDKPAKWSSIQMKLKKPPSLPLQPPVGQSSSRDHRKQSPQKNKKLKSFPSYRQDQSFVV